jgi:hypothetical protein
MWSVHNFIAYNIFVGWSVHRRLSCPICGSYTDCFYLTSGGKIWCQIEDVLSSGGLVQIVLKQIWCHANQCVWQEASLHVPHVGPYVTCSGPGGHYRYHGKQVPHVPTKIMYQGRTDYISPTCCHKACRRDAMCATRAGPTTHRARSGGAMRPPPLMHHQGKSGLAATRHQPHVSGTKRWSKARLVSVRGVSILRS